MRKLKLSIALDGLFVFGISFFIFYAIVKPKILSVFTATGVSVVLSALVSFLFMLVISHKQKLKGDKEDRLNMIDALNNYLYLLKDSEIIKLISSYLDTINQAFEVKKSAFYFKENKSVLYFNFSPDELSLTNALEFYKKTPKSYKLVILASNYDKKVLEFFADFKEVSLYKTSDLYIALEEKNLLPKLTVKNRQKITFNKLIAHFLQRKNVKKFFIYGALLLLFSTVTYYKFFYVFVGTLFLITATYLKFFANEKP